VEAAADALAVGAALPVVAVLAGHRDRDGVRPGDEAAGRRGVLRVGRRRVAAGAIAQAGKAADVVPRECRVTPPMGAPKAEPARRSSRGMLATSVILSKIACGIDYLDYLTDRAAE
jgi:hypothetical protein